MSAQEGSLSTATAAPAQPRCRCCNEPAFGQNVIDTGQLCLKHTELRVFLWRLEKRGEAAELGNLHEYMTRVHRPVTFSLKELPELWKQYQSAEKEQA